MSDSTFPNVQQIEKKFCRALSKAGWYTYRDDETGRVVTNAYLDERIKLEKISGLACEVVGAPLHEKHCAKIGPKITNA